MAVVDRVYLPLDEWLDVDEWPVAGLIPDELENVLISPPELDAAGDTKVPFALLTEIVLRIPGVNAFALALGGSGTVEFNVTITKAPFEAMVSVPLVLRVDAEILRPLKPGTKEPDLDAGTLDIDLGTVDLSVDGDGNIDLGVTGSVTVPRCMLGTTGVLLEIGKLQWVTPATQNKPPNTPAGFTGLYLDDVFVEIPQLLAAANALRMDDVFLGTGDFSGKVTNPNITLSWDGTDFQGPLAGDLFGFKGGLSAVTLEFRQNALVGCSIAGDVFVPYLDKRIGLTLGLDGAGGLTATAGPPTSAPAETGVRAGGPGYLLHLKVGDFLDLDVDALRFEAPAEGPPLLEISGRIELNVPGLDCPPVGLKGLRIDADGGVAIEGGWIDLDSARMAPFYGFPLEITKMGFGSTDAGRRWLGLNGGIKLADGLPLGTSVEGLRISWDPDNLAPSVSLEGIGLDVAVPGTFEFEGAVSFFDENGKKGFRGHVELELTTLQLTVDADLVVGRTADGDTYFFLHLDADFPTGIPLFATGAAFYGFQGLVATSMAPDRRSGETWYYGWYLRKPEGAAEDRKWRVEPGAFALGVGATIGTAMDDGFSFSSKAMLILVLPGPRLMLEGRGSFLRKRPDSSDPASQGALKALLVLDVPARLFQANLEAAYNVRRLLALRGSADVAFSWAEIRPADVWHVYLGEEKPMERRWRADFLSIFRANSYFQLRRDELALGAWVRVDEDWRFGPVRAWFKASLGGDGVVSRRPQQLKGELRLRGNAGLSAFGVKVGIAVGADVGARGPKPWHLYFAVRLAIEVDLLLKTFRWSKTIKFSWGDPDRPLAQPALPVVERVAIEHLKSDESADLAGATVPPDGRPVVIFRRPVRDLARIGAPGDPVLPAELVGPKVGPRKFSYQLGHLVLRKRDGSNQLIAASGVLDVDDGTISLPGDPDLSGAGGGKLELLDEAGRSFDVTSVGNGTLTASDDEGISPSSRSDAPYRLLGPSPQATVEILFPAEKRTYSTADVTLSADPGGGPNAFAGGQLQMGDLGWTVLSNNGMTVTVRFLYRSSGAPVLPSAGQATLSGASNPRLEGVWLPASDEEASPENPPATKLMLWASTPYAWFRRSDQETIEGWDQHNDEYACGPEIVEEPICIDFDDLPVGSLPQEFQTDLLSGSAEGDVQVVASAANPSDHSIAVGTRPGGGGASGRVTLRFDPPVEHLWVYCSTHEGGTMTGRLRGAEVVQEFIRVGDPGVVEIEREVDEVEIRGTLVEITRVCFLPGWTCLTFDEVSFPQGSTGRQSYAGVWLTSNCTMSVDAGILNVDAPCSPRTARFFATLLVELPEPVTRVRVGLESGPATVSAMAGSQEVTNAAGNAGDEVLLISHDGWIDRIAVTSFNPIAVRRICHDGGPFAWRRYEQWAWQNSIRHSVESFYQEAPILLPGKYQLEVVTAWDDEADKDEPVWNSLASEFSVGPPPGLGTGEEQRYPRYPAGGPLNDLATYVEATLPGAGERPFYRSYDVGVAFNENYVTRMFLAAHTLLTVSVVDSNDQDRRAGAPNVWGRGPELELSKVVEAWIKTLHGDGTRPCATIDAQKIVRNEGVRAGAGELLAPNELHAGQLWAASKCVYRFEFVTSRFAGFVHHLATFDGRCRALPTDGAGPEDPAALVAPAVKARQELKVAGSEFQTASETVKQGPPPRPTRADFDEYHLKRAQLEEARAALPPAREAAFQNAWKAYKLPDQRPLPSGVEVACLARGFLVESPEPMHWERLTLTIGRNPNIPLRRSTLTFDRVSFGAPDKGKFRYGGLEWDTDAELRVVGDGVETRVDQPWTLVVGMPDAHSVELVVRVAPGGSATLQGSGTGVSADATQGETPPDSSATMIVRGDALTSVTLSGTGISLLSLSYVEPFRPASPRGPLRILGAALPPFGSDQNHIVDFVAYGDTDLTGWTIRWVGALAPGTPSTYHAFAGGQLRDGRVARVIGSLPSGEGHPGVDTYFGGTEGTVPASGAIFQLVDPSGSVAHEVAVLPYGFYQPISGMVAIPNSDGTRAFLLSTTGPLDAGHWRLSFRFDRNAGPGLPVLSVGGNTYREQADLTFTVE